MVAVTANGAPASTNSPPKYVPYLSSRCTYLCTCLSAFPVLSNRHPSSSSSHQHAMQCHAMPCNAMPCRHHPSPIPTPVCQTHAQHIGLSTGTLSQAVALLSCPRYGAHHCHFLPALQTVTRYSRCRFGVHVPRPRHAVDFHVVRYRPYRRSVCCWCWPWSLPSPEVN